MDKIIARYSVCDCEHQGDIDYACGEVRELGGEVITTEWDGDDCGEAYVYCLIDADQFERLHLEDDWSWRKAEYMRDSFEHKGWIK